MLMMGARDPKEFWKRTALMIILKRIQAPSQEKLKKEKVQGIGEIFLFFSLFHTYSRNLEKFDVGLTIGNFFQNL